MLEMLAGLLVALAALAVVLEPLLRPGSAPGVTPAGPDESDLVDVRDMDSPKVQALIALREIDFDRATGKLSDEDYATLKTKYEAAALAAIRAEEAVAGAGEAAGVAEAAGAAAASVSSAAPQVVAPVKGGNGARRVVCPTCGPRPETAPIFCSTCGRSLVVRGGGPRCRHCGAGLNDTARFCAECGGAVQAGGAGA